MNEVHTYPIPDSEFQKLGELPANRPIDMEGMATRSNQWIRKNAVAATLIACLAGFMVGQRLRR